jgi:hypothetical protein
MYTYNYSCNTNNYYSTTIHIESNLMLLSKTSLSVKHIRFRSRTDINAHRLAAQETFQYQIEII